MRQFVLPPEYDGGREWTLSGRDAHYLLKVLRLQAGATFPGTDRGGRRFTISLSGVFGESCRLTIDPEVCADGGDDSPAITLFQCLPKGQKMDLIIRQAVEAGVGRIVPIASEHSVPQLHEEERARKGGRWARIVREAVQQSGARRNTEVSGITPFDAIPAEWNGRGIGLYFHQAPLANKTLHEYLSGNTDEIALVIGPEGGLSDGEIDLLSNAAFNAVYLGGNVLRVETAALYAVAAVQIVLLEKDSWKVQPRSNG